MVRIDVTEKDARELPAFLTTPFLAKRKSMHGHSEVLVVFRENAVPERNSKLHFSNGVTRP